MPGQALNNIGKIRLSVILPAAGFILVLGWSQRAEPPRMRVALFPASTMAGTAGTYRLSFILDDESMAAGGGVKIRFVKGFGKPQANDPVSPGYATAAASNPGTTVRITQILEDDPAVSWPVDRNAWVLTAIVAGNALRRGDTLHVVLGASPQGLLPGPGSAFIDTVRVACDLSGNGGYQEIYPPPVLTILPEAPYRLSAHLPSRVAAGEIADLKIAVLDVRGNLASSFAGAVEISSTEAQSEFPPRITFTPEDQGRKTVPVRFAAAGIQSLRFTAAGLALQEAVSNPVEVTAGKPEYYLYWGDLHSHSSFSFDGYGKDPFIAARDAAGLDFYALTEHSTYGAKKNSGLTAAEWEQVKKDIVRYHQPGRFVTIPAYEFSAPPPSGHHNVYFNAHDQIVPYIPLLRDEDYGFIQNVWAVKERVLPPGIDMITVPHHTGIMWGVAADGAITHSAVSFGPGFGNAKMRPLIELFSQHGSSEAYEPDHPLSYKSLHYINDRRDCVDGPHYAQDAWALGEWLGVIASSDDHTSRPGRANLGLAAVYARELTRTAIFEALKSRRTYATTGKRMLLHFEVNGHLMGAKFTLPAREYPRLKLKVVATEDLDFVEVLRWEINKGVHQNGHPVFLSLLKSAGHGREFEREMVDSTYSGSALYYARARQKRSPGDNREGWAWSSPVWVYEQGDTNVDEQANSPRRFELSRAHPNPFKKETALRYYLPQAGRVKGVLYNTLGQQIEVVLQAAQTAGWHDFKIRRKDWTSGIYFVRLEAAGRIATQKILLVE